MLTKQKSGVTSHKVAPLQIKFKNQYQKSISKINIMKKLDDVYLTMERFEKELDYCLNIVSYPSKRNPFYKCEHISAALETRAVNIYIV